MHHTDYSRNLLNAKHKLNKNSATNAPYGNSTRNSHTNPLLAVVAAALVIWAILQMDPANAESTLDLPGYGTLQFTHMAQPVRAMVIANDLNMLVEDNELAMLVSQTFANQTAQLQTGEYAIPLPENTQVMQWSMQLVSERAKSHKGNRGCSSQTTMLAASQEAQIRRVGNQLYIQTPVLAPGQHVRVQLDIRIPKTSKNTVMATSPQVIDQLATKSVRSVAAASTFIGSPVSMRSFGALQPIGTISDTR